MVLAQHIHNRKAGRNRQLTRAAISTFYVFLMVFSVLIPVSLHAEEAEVADGEQKLKEAQKSFTDRFLEFTGDKNVMGKTKTVDGKVQLSGTKTRFDQDDGVSYKSDLTYHDFVFKIPDQQAQKEQEKDPNAKGKNRELFPFISPHGGESEAGGSSLLERTVYEEHKRLSEQQEQDPEKLKKEEEQTGTKLRSVFKITTQELIVDPNNPTGAAGGGAAAGGAGAGGAGAGGGANDKKEPEKIAIERLEIVEDVRKKIEKVGEDSVQTIERSARDKENQDDENTMGNILMYYEAGARAAESWWNSTLANLSQRRSFKEIKAGFGDGVTLGESSATCESWAKEQQQVIAKIENAESKKAAEEELQQTIDKCKKVAQTSYSTVNPRFKEDPNNKGGGELESEGPNTEDSISRDLRNQLEVLSKAGASVSKLPSNWKYDSKEEKSRVTTEFDENAKPAGEGEKSVSESIEEYNTQLDEAAQAYAGVKERFPQLDVQEEDITQYKIDPEKTSVKDIMLRPVLQALEEEAGVKAPESSEDPENYDQLLKKVQE